jgi:peroxiredoxin
MRTDLKLGARLPDLELPDHLGRVMKLSEIAGKFPLIVTFYRGWW